METILAREGLAVRQRKKGKFEACLLKFVWPGASRELRTSYELFVQSISSNNHLTKRFLEFALSSSSWCPLPGALEQRETSFSGVILRNFALFTACTLVVHCLHTSWILTAYTVSQQMPALCLKVLVSLCCERHLVSYLNADRPLHFIFP
jgi:hypothetical protein